MQGKNYDVFVSWGNCGIIIAQSAIQADGHRPADPIRALQRVEGPWIVAGQMPGAKRNDKKKGRGTWE